MLYIGGVLQSDNMHFYDVTRCNYFANELTKRFGNFKYYTQIPSNKLAVAYCIPKLVDPNKIIVY